MCMNYTCYNTDFTDVIYLERILTELHTNKSLSGLIPAMFFSTAVAMIFTQLAGYVANLIDGIVTSRYLGSDAYSGVSLLGPLNGLVLLLSGIASTSTQIISSQAIGRGDKDKANSAFTAALILDAIFAGVLLSMCIFCPDQILKVCGITRASHPSIYPHMFAYLRGYMLGIPFMMLIQVIGPIIVMDSGKALFSASAFVLCAGDIAGDLLNVFVFHGGTYGMGIATSASYVLQAAILLTHFMKRTTYLRLSLKAFTPGQIPEMFHAVTPFFTMRFATFLRNLTVNRLNISVALTTAAIAARGIQNDLNSALFCIGIGIGKSLLTMTGMFFGADDRQGLTHLFTYAMKLSLIIAGGVGAVIFFSAEWIAEFFTSEPEVIGFAAFSIKCMALALAADALSIAFSYYLQGVNERKLVNIINFSDRFVIPVATAWVMGIYFGSEGIMASLAVGKIILLVFLAGIIYYRTGSLKNCMFLPENFGGAKSDNIYASIASMDDVSRESIRAESFCLEHGHSTKRAKLMSLFVEEIAGNIITHGKPKLWHKLKVDYRLALNGGKICMTLRDCCGYFDPLKFHEAHKDEFSENMPGIKIVMGLADDVRYFNAFNSNNIMIYIDTKE